MQSFAQNQFFYCSSTLIPTHMKKLVPPAGRLLVPVLACCLPLAVATAAPVAAPTTTWLRKASQPAATVTGRVTDAKGEGIPGVTVLVKGTTTGVTTDVNGNFTVEVPENAILVVSSIGYFSQEIPVNGRTTINLTLNNSDQNWMR
jgi:hypothetical protein